MGRRALAGCSAVGCLEMLSIISALLPGFATQEARRTQHLCPAWTGRDFPSHHLTGEPVLFLAVGLGSDGWWQHPAPTVLWCHLALVHQKLEKQPEQQHQCLAHLWLPWSLVRKSGLG